MTDLAPLPDRALLGIDVGTGSARAGVFTPDGGLLGSAKHDIALFRDGVTVEQSSGEIWAAVATAVRGAVAAAGIDAGRIAGIGVDATCSLVVVGPDGTGLPVGAPNRPERDIVVWMDHRATDQARRINAAGHDVLRYVGGAISPEMETPKLLWLKENRPDTFARAAAFFDLTDYLTWRATGSLARSSCTVTCKWTYLAHEGRWDASYFRQIGLAELAEDDFARIGAEVVAPGTALGAGLTQAAAADLGLPPGTPVAAGLIDAHAGGVGSVGAAGGGGPTANMAYVFGTSSCTMTSTAAPAFVPGVWGPYQSAMVPDLWLNEGGQSAAGAAIAQLLDFHPHAAEAHEVAEAAGQSLPDWLAEQASARADPDGGVLSLAAGLHVVPEFLGNRAPYADPDTRAVVAGLGMDRDLDSLIGLYVAGLCGLGYGLRQIVEAQERAGVTVGRIVISGGAGRSDLIRQLLADATGIEVAAPGTEEPVLIGAAILGGVAGGSFGSVVEGMTAMTSFARTYRPAGGASAALHARRFAIFERLQAVARDAAGI